MHKCTAQQKILPVRTTAFTSLPFFQLRVVSCDHGHFQRPINLVDDFHEHDVSQRWVIDFTGNCLLEMREAQECSMTVLFGAAIVAHTFTPYRFSVREHNSQRRACLHDDT